MASLTLLQLFFWNNGSVGEHDSFILPNDTLSASDAEFLDRVHGLGSDDLAAGDDERLAALCPKKGSMAAATIPPGKCITRLCQIHYDMGC